MKLKPVICAVLMVALVGVPGFCQTTYVLNTSYSPPHSTRTQQGYLDLILKEAFTRAGYAAEIRMLPAERCLQDSNSGISDGEIGRIRTMPDYYPNLVLVDEPIIENRNFVAFSIDHEFETRGWDSLKPYNVAIMRGWKIFEVNVTGTKSLVLMDSTLSMFELLKNRRVDVGLNAEIDGRYQAKLLGIKDIKVMKPPFASVELYLFMHKKHKLVVPDLEQALKGMKADRTFYKIRTTILNQLIY